MLYDRAEKKRRGYVEKDSIVRQDGSEKLVGRDWNKRKLELWERCGGRCEFVNLPGNRCVLDCDHPHHATERWRGRDDRLSNLVGLCRGHHWQIDQRKIGGRKQRSAK